MSTISINHNGFTATIKPVSGGAKFRWTLTNSTLTGIENTSDLALREAWWAIRYELAKQRAEMAVTNAQFCRFDASRAD